MITITARYRGETHCEITDEAGHHVESSAPREYGGDESDYTPTDYIGVALACCTLTTIALGAERKGLDLRGSTVRVEKEMGPSRVSRLATFVTLPAAIPEEHRRALEISGRGCFVAESLHPEIERPIAFDYSL